MAADLPHVIGEPLPHRIRAITAVIHEPAPGSAAPSPACGGGQGGGFSASPGGEAAPTPTLPREKRGREFTERVIGIGGLGYRPDGTVIAFAHMTDELKRYPAAVHRAGRMGMALIRSSGVPLVVAEAQSYNPAAERWLIHFGFQPTKLCGRKAFVWRRQPNVE